MIPLFSYTFLLSDSISAVYLFRLYADKDRRRLFIVTHNMYIQTKRDQVARECECECAESESETEREKMSIHGLS